MDVNPNNRSPQLREILLRPKAKANRFPSITVLRKAAEVANVHILSANMSISFATLEKLYSHQQYLDMAELRLERRQSEGFKRFEIVLKILEQ
jgi:hypothetical protein